MPSRELVVASLLASAAWFACKGSGNAPAPSAEPPTTPARAPAPSADPEPVAFAAYLAGLDQGATDSLHRARAELEARHRPGADPVAAARDFELLLDFYVEAIGEIESLLRRQDAELDPYLCSLGDYCEQEMKKVKDATKREVARMLDAGVKVIPGGEGMPALAPDLVALVRRFSDRLPAADVAYAEASAYEADNVLFDDGVYVGKVADAASALLRWHAVAKAHPRAREAAVDAKLGSALYRYLTLCQWDGAPDACEPVSPELISEYQRFIRDHADSRYVAPVQAFLDKGKTRHHRWTAETLEAFVMAELVRLGHDPASEAAD